MADKKITDLTRLTDPVLADVLPIVNGGETKKTLVGDIAAPIRNYNTPLTASGIVISGPIVPSTPSGSSLGTVEFPFGDLFVSSGSINIASDVPGDPNTSLSNEGGNILVSAGGMRLVQPGNSFIAETGSFQYISGSLTQVGSYNRIGNTITTGSVDFSGSFTASLQSGYMWIGNSNNRTTTIPTSSLYTKTNFGFYGSFYSTASQYNPVGNVSRSMMLETLVTSNGVSVVSGSRMKVSGAGVYNLQFSAQLEKSDNGVDTVYIWFKKNGLNIPDSATSLDILKDAGGSGRFVAAWNFVDTFNANDYIEIVWQSDDINVSIPYVGPSGNIPAIPSVIATLTQVS